MVLTTDNKVLVENFRPLPTIMCAQRKAEKVDITEEKLIKANIDSFGDDIGKTTNWITTMFDVQAQFDRESEEYKVLDYRIKCGQLYQQNAIDKAKGIICKPMPKHWYDRGANRITDEMTESEIAQRKFNIRILADKKPYFMRYIYPALMSQYNTYIKNTEKKCVREFRQGINEILSKGSAARNEQEREFIKYYYQRMPVGIHDCVMNRICCRFENEFDSYFSNNSIDERFNYDFMKSGQEYTSSQYKKIAKLYEEYTKRLQEYIQFSKKERVDEDEMASRRSLMIANFKSDCFKVSSNSATMCDIIIDLCYSRSGSKQFVWDICGEEIIENLLKNNNGVISYPVMSDSGSIKYDGRNFVFKSKEILHDEYSA